MSTNFPTALDSFIDPVSGQPMNAPNQANLVSNLNDAVAALQQKVGINSSTDHSTIDWIINHFTGGGDGTVTSVSSPDNSITITDDTTTPTFELTPLTGDITSSASVTTLKHTGPGALTNIGDATHSAQISIDIKGRVTALTSVPITGGGSGGSGTVTNVSGDTGGTIIVTNPTTTPVVERGALIGDVTAPAGSKTTTLASITTATGPIGSSTVVPIVTIDTKGRVTGLSSTTIAGSTLPNPTAAGQIAISTHAGDWTGSLTTAALSFAGTPSSDSAAGNPGSSNEFSLGDHSHPLPTAGFLVVSPFSSGIGAQVATNQRAMLYTTITGGGTLTVAISATNSSYTALYSTVTVATTTIFPPIVVPVGWFVKFTMAAGATITNQALAF